MPGGQSWEPGQGSPQQNVPGSEDVLQGLLDTSLPAGGRDRNGTDAAPQASGPVNRETDTAAQGLRPPSASAMPWKDSQSPAKPLS